jgi:apolipoprotein N-acyltransferase
MGGLLFYGLKRYPSHNTFWALIVLLGVTVTGTALKTLSFGTIIGSPLSVSMVQGDIPQSVKWQPGFLQDAASIYVNLSLAHADSDLLVWPEAAIPGTLSQVDISALQKAIAKNHSTLITGAIDEDATHYYNAMLVMGEGSGKYYKEHLVPFGEYLPFENQLRGLIAFFNLPMSNLRAGPENQAPLMAHNYRFDGFICYEIAYLPIVLRALPDSNFLVSISDDSWFGYSLAAYQQEVMAQFRSIETARYQITVGNDGITAVIDNKGHITSQLPRFERGVLTDVIYPMQGETPLVFLGWKALLAFLGLLTFWGIFRYRHSGKKGARGS